MSERDEFGAFLVGFIVGGLTGAVVSLLLAPKTGEDTRTYLRDKAIELRDKAADTVEDTFTQAQTAADEAVRQAEELLKVAQTRATELQQRGQVILEEQLTKKKGEPKPLKVVNVADDEVAA